MTIPIYAMKRGYVAIPNKAIDTATTELSPSAAKAYYFVLRKTLGWRKQSDRLAISQICKGAGLARATARKAMRELKDKAFIDVGDTTAQGTLVTIPKIEDYYTAIPNDFFGVMPELTGNETKIYMLLAQRSFGSQSKCNAGAYPYWLLEQDTNAQRKELIRLLNSLEAKQVIKITNKGHKEFEFLLSDCAELQAKNFTTAEDFGEKLTPANEPIDFFIPPDEQENEQILAEYLSAEGQNFDNWQKIDPQNVKKLTLQHKDIHKEPLFCFNFVKQQKDNIKTTESPNFALNQKAFCCIDLQQDNIKTTESGISQSVSNTLPTLDDITPKLGGTTMLDKRKGVSRFDENKTFTTPTDYRDNKKYNAPAIFDEAKPAAFCCDFSPRKDEIKQQLHSRALFTLDVIQGNYKALFVDNKKHNSAEEKIINEAWAEIHKAKAFIQRGKQEALTLDENKTPEGNHKSEWVAWDDLIPVDEIFDLEPIKQQPPKVEPQKPKIEPPKVKQQRQLDLYEHELTPEEVFLLEKPSPCEFLDCDIDDLPPELKRYELKYRDAKHREKYLEKHGTIPKKY